MKLKFRALSLLFFVLIVGLTGCKHKPATTTTTTIPVGTDLFQTDPETTFFNFEKMPIPAGFFTTDSYPFTGTVKFRGGTLPSSYFNGLEITQVDTIVKREQPLTLSASYPASGKVSVEMIALSLVSEEPIKVQVGDRQELWNVEVVLSTHRPSKGTMVITKTNADGGTFESELMIYPLFRFIRLADDEQKILDTGTLELTKEMQDRLTLRTSQAPWRHTAPGVLTIKGLNDNFIAGAPGVIKESGDACAHVVREPADEPALFCTVTAIRDDTKARFKATGTTVPGAAVSINVHEQNCNPVNITVHDFLPGQTANAAGNYTFGPVSAFPSSIPGVGRKVLIKVSKGGKSAFCCTEVQAGSVK